MAWATSPCPKGLVARAIFTPVPCSQPEGDVERELSGKTKDYDRNTQADRLIGQEALQIVDVSDRFAVEGDDDVAIKEARLIGERFLLKEWGLRNFVAILPAAFPPAGFPPRVPARRDPEQDDRGRIGAPAGPAWRGDRPADRIGGNGPRRSLRRDVRLR